MHELKCKQAFTHILYALLVCRIYLPSK